MIDTLRLREEAQSCGISLEQETAEKLDIYARLLVEWNEKMNLTAITAPGEIVTKHFVDSLTAGALLPASGEEPLTLVDVGTGAGFPGVPLALWRPDIRLTLLDSLNKRLVFLETVCRELELPSRWCMPARKRPGGERICVSILQWQRPARWRRCRLCVNIACRWSGREAALLR